MGESVFTLAHLSDWHATTLEGATRAELATKRFWGWWSWRRKRRLRHRPEVLRALLEDVRAQAPDHVVVTGDLTNVALEQEFEEAADALRTLGDPSWVTLVPGNHDAYVAVAHERTWQQWAPYLKGDGAAPEAAAPRFDDFPTLRVRGDVAIVGACSALPTPLFMAHGRLGAAQIARIEGMLGQARERGLFRVLALHHPPHARGVSLRRRLRDHAALAAALRRTGAELIVHGHSHRTVLTSLPGPEGAIPVVGVRSASDAGPRDEKRAQYHLYRIERRAAGPPRVRLELRGWDADRGAVVDAGEHDLASGP